MPPIIATILLGASLVAATAAGGQEVPLGQKPMLGWSSWNKFGCNINESVILNSAKAIKAQGLFNLGYEYIAIDDCWQAADRDEQTNAPVADPAKFPSGMKNLTDKLHEMGFKAGIYSSAGTYTCQHLFGSLHYEEIDAKTYADMGFDLLKYDNCYNEGLSGTPKISHKRYKKMADAIRATGRPVWYYMCNWGEDATWNWASEYAQSYRVTGDVGDNYDRFDARCPCENGIDPCPVPGYQCSIMNIIEKAAPVVHKSIPGSWADLDGLEVGNGGSTTDEYKTQISLWSLVKSPLMLGHDPTETDGATLRLISNKHVLDVNQDPLGRAGYRVWKRTDPAGGNTQLWRGDLSNGAYVLLIINSTPLNQRVEVNMKDFFRNQRISLKDFEMLDLWKDARSLGQLQEVVNLNVPTHGVRMMKLEPRKHSIFNLDIQFW